MSNSIGSNVFDILVGLGLPWALKTLAINYGSDVSSAIWKKMCSYLCRTKKNQLSGRQITMKSANYEGGRGMG